jgi:hypothetical protein
LEYLFLEVLEKILLIYEEFLLLALSLAEKTDSSKSSLSPLFLLALLLTLGFFIVTGSFNPVLKLLGESLRLSNLRPEL